MSNDRDVVPIAWKIGVVLFIPTLCVVIVLALREGYTPPSSGQASDEAARAAAREIRQAMQDAEHVRFEELPADLMTLDGRRRAAYLLRGFELCGQIDLAELEGEWRAPGPDGWQEPRIFDGRLQAGRPLRMEFCPVHVVERAPRRILAVAVWHEDVDDPGDARLIYLELRRRGDTLEVRLDDDRSAVASRAPVVLRTGPER